MDLILIRLIKTDKCNTFPMGHTLSFLVVTYMYKLFDRILLFHTHSLRQPLAHFLDPPSLPPEDLEPVPEKQVKLSIFA